MMKFINASLASAPRVNRRSFLKVTAMGSAGFMIGCGESAAPVADTAPVADAEPVTSSELNAFVKIGSDNHVTVVVKHLDMGQGVSTGLPTIVAEELDADWSQMHYEFAPSDPAVYANTFFGIQGTGGSTATANSWMQLRNAAAAARSMLVDAAAADWQVPAAEISVAGGEVAHTASGNRASFGELAAAAATMTPPETPSLKSPEQFTLIGAPLPRLDSASKTDGSANYTIDLERPGMKVALMAHPPRFGATVKSFDAEKALAMDGVVDVKAVERGVAVVAESFWAAKKARDALTIEWDNSVAEMRGSDQIMSDFKAMADTQGALARADGDSGAALAKASQVIEYRFELPFLAHATMETMDCVAELSEDGCDVWTGSQLQTVDHQTIATIAGVPMGNVRIHTQLAGGSFGRRAVPDSDYIAEAVSIAKAVDGAYPVKLIWTREDDFAGGRYRPMGYHVARAGMDEAGNPVGWEHRVVTQSFMVGTPFEGSIQNGVDASSVEGAAQLPYAIDDVTVDLHLARVGVPTLWWRSVGHTHNAWVAEVMIEQLARTAGQDPVEYRMNLLADHPRHQGVLKLAAEKAGWSTEPAEGIYRGVAEHESYSS